MASAIFSLFQNLWPFSRWKTDDDLKASEGLVQALQISDQTKQFTFAICEPKSQAVVYLLATQNLSEQSALDAEYLIKEVQPEAVLAQIAPSALIEIQAEENGLRDADEEVPIPASSFGVLKKAFISKIGRQEYENLAGGQVLRDIFGIGFYGHFLTAKKAAKEVNSTFLCLDSPFIKTCHDGKREADIGNAVMACLLQASNLFPGKVPSTISSNTKRLCLNNQLQSQMVKSLSSSLALSMTVHLKPKSAHSDQQLEPGDYQLSGNYQAPSYAQSVYILLADLHDIFVDLPSIRKALVYAQKILVDIGRGDYVDAKLLSEVYNFQIAVEGLRIALNDIARLPANKMNNAPSRNVEFLELPDDEKGYVLLAQALKSQTKRFRSIVAIVDASSLAGVRKHWNTPVPQEIAELAEQYFTSYENDGEAMAENADGKSFLANNPVVAVGAGASAIVGASSLSKIVPMSTFMKLITYNVPASLKICLAHMQRSVPIALTKTLGSSKIIAPSIASSGAKSSMFKLAASTEKIHAVTHSLIASAERTSFQAMRTAFYEIMRRRGKPVGFVPWAAFGCSIATCAGLYVCGDGIECAAESAPAAPTIACLGRGLRSLHQASQEVRETNGTKIQEAIKSFMYCLKKIKVQ